MPFLGDKSVKDAVKKEMAKSWLMPEELPYDFVCSSGWRVDTYLKFLWIWMYHRLPLSSYPTTFRETFPMVTTKQIYQHFWMADNFNQKNIFRDSQLYEIVKYMDNEESSGMVLTRISMNSSSLYSYQDWIYQVDFVIAYLDFLSSGIPKFEFQLSHLQNALIRDQSFEGIPSSERTEKTITFCEWYFNLLVYKDNGFTADEENIIKRSITKLIGNNGAVFVPLLVLFYHTPYKNFIWCFNDDRDCIRKDTHHSCLHKSTQVVPRVGLDGIKIYSLINNPVDEENLIH